jgi:hypothetical protein
MPTSTDLVTDLPADFEVFGQAVDTSLADLKGGTTGQILSKNSNTNMDFTWITNDVGDITAVTAGTGITGGGTSGDVTVSFDQANFGGGQGAAGKNACVNGGFDIWQRGTSFTISSGVATYTADRWQVLRAATGLTVSRQATNDTTNLPFIQYCARLQRANGNTATDVIYMDQNFESVNSIPFAGRTVIVSFYARAGANYSSTSNALSASLISGTGTDQNGFSGLTGAATPASTTATLTTTWQRFTFSGTIATNATQLLTRFNYAPTGTAGANDFFEITGIQLELGASATPFKRNGANIQGELAACQRYYYRQTYAAVGDRTAVGYNPSTSIAYIVFPFPVTMRTAPSALEQSGTGTDYSVSTSTGTVTCNAVPTFFTGNALAGGVTLNFAAAALPAGVTSLFRNATTNAYLGWSAEL